MKPPLLDGKSFKPNPANRDDVEGDRIGVRIHDAIYDIVAEESEKDLDNTAAACASALTADLALLLLQSGMSPENAVEYFRMGLANANALGMLEEFETFVS